MTYEEEENTTLFWVIEADHRRHSEAVYQEEGRNKFEAVGCENGATAPAAAIVIRKAVHQLEWEGNGLGVENMVIILTLSERLEQVPEQHV
jgi:hypothetical protein